MSVFTEQDEKTLRYLHGKCAPHCATGNLLAELARVRADNASLRDALKEACDELEYALEYKMPYLVAKHGDMATLARLRAVAAAKEATEGGAT